MKNNLYDDSTSDNESKKPKKIIIQENLDLNKLSDSKNNFDDLEKPGIIKSIEFKTPMMIEVENEPILSNILTCIQPIDYLIFKYGDEYIDLKERFDNSSGKEKASISEQIEKKQISFDEKIVITLENLLLKTEEIGYSLGYLHNKIYVFNLKYWKQFGSEPLMKEFLGLVSAKSGLDTYVVRQTMIKNKLYDQFITSCSLPDVMDNINKIDINFNNGTFVFDNGKEYLREFRKSDYKFYCLDFDYEPHAKTEIWEKFINRVLPDRLCQNILLEFIGYIFLNINLAKAMILLGGGRNGKSVVTQIVENIVGVDNMCGFTLMSLADRNGYSRAELVSKLVNYSDEIGNGKYDIDVWKKLVSGGRIEARSPFGKPFMLKINTKFIFNANSLHISEPTIGFKRRHIIIPFDVTIPELEQDIDLADKICLTDLPGIFNLVLEGMKRLVNNKKFTTSPISEAALEKYMKDSDSVSSFIDDELWFPSIEKSCLLQEFYLLYRQYCLNNGCSHICKSRTFSERLRGLGFKIAPGTNNYTYVWCEIHRGVSGLAKDSDNDNPIRFLAQMKQK